MTNISKRKREALLSKLEELKNNLNDDEMVAVINEVESELSRKKYGLVWEEHEERVDIEMQTKIPVFTEIKNKEIKELDENKYNFLLEGDNLHSLKLLEKTHKSKIDVIYIDPPYNTGNKDFVYNDKIINDDDVFKHSKWLSFMHARLKFVMQMLSSNGVIFISIDNNEYAQLKLLCDDTFGEDKYVTTIHVELSATQGMKVKSAKNGNIVKNAEYILVYSKRGNKNIAKNILFDNRPEYDNHYSKYLDDSNIIRNLKDIFLEEYPDESIGNIVEEYRNNDVFKTFIHKNVDKIFRFDKTTGFSNSDIPTNTIFKLFKNNRNYTLFNNGKSVEQLMFLKDSFGSSDDFKKSYGLRKIRGDWWKDFYLDMGNVAKEGNTVFSNGKKPLRLIQQLLYMVTDSSSTVLDFFAGSGTTAHAVMELNKEDNGGRKFILATNNENNICKDITYQRIKNVIKGYSKYEPIESNLKYYKTEFVDKSSDGTVSMQLMNHIKELIQLEHHIDIDNEEITVVFNELELDEVLTHESIENCKKLFIPSDIFTTAKQDEVIEKLGIDIIEIPTYYFAEELREVNEL